MSTGFTQKWYNIFKLMDYATCQSAVILQNSIFYYKTCPNNQVKNSTYPKFPQEVFSDSITFGITAYSENNSSTSRVKNCLNNAALYTDLQKLKDLVAKQYHVVTKEGGGVTKETDVVARQDHVVARQGDMVAMQGDVVVRHGYSFVEESEEDLERGFLVSVKVPVDNTHPVITAIPELAKKYKQTYYYRYRCEGDHVIQELIRTEGQKIIDTSAVIPSECPTVHPAFITRHSSALFHRASDAVQVMSQLESQEAEEILKIAEECTSQNEGSSHGNSLHHPFIVIEGLDGAGKTTLTSRLRERLGAVTLRSPPDVLRPLRGYFDSQPDLIRRAYYTIGNYIVAQQILQQSKQHTVIMDRFWHSTAAYTIATETEGGDVTSLPPAGHWAYEWPADMVKPHLVIFLSVNEEVRGQRLQSREEPITLEEVKLRHSLMFRQRLYEAYHRMQNPAVTDIDASPDAETVLQNTLQQIHKTFNKLNID